MSLITLDDFEFSSGDERQNEEYSFSDDESAQGSNNASDEHELQDQGTDGDEYASCITDFERYLYDQQRWGTIRNTRKYTSTIRQRKSKGGDESQKNKAKQDNPKMQDLSKAEIGPRGNTDNRSDALPDQIDISEEGETYYDARERATYHHWIRFDLSKIENSKGAYTFPRKRGIGSNDYTCFNEVGAHWGLERPNYAPVMFEWQRRSRVDPKYPLDNLYYEGRLVVDYWREPVRHFREIPLVISSAFEGAFMEPALRLHGKMSYEDIRARMPPYIEFKKTDPPVFKALYKSSTLSERCRHFRESAGAISWNRKDGSSQIQSFIEDIVKPVNNSTRGSRDLTEDEIGKLRLVNHGTKPTRAKAGTTQKSKDRYIAHTLKAAGGSPAAGSQQEPNDPNEHTRRLEAADEEVVLSEGENHQGSSNGGWKVNYLLDYDSLYNDPDGFVENPLAYEKDVTAQDDGFEQRD